MPLATVSWVLATPSTSIIHSRSVISVTTNSSPRSAGGVERRGCTTAVEPAALTAVLPDPAAAAATVAPAAASARVGAADSDRGATRPPESPPSPSMSTSEWPLG